MGECYQPFGAGRSFACCCRNGTASSRSLAACPCLASHPRLKNFPLSEDAKAFRDWSQHYEEMTFRAGQIDEARLYDLIPELCGYTQIRKPRRLVCYGFDIITPQQAALLAGLQKIGCEVVMAQPQPWLQPHSPMHNPTNDPGVRRISMWQQC